VKVLGHRDITVDVVAPFVPIFELFCLKNFRSRGLEEHFAPFPRVRGNEIRLSGFRSVFRSSHVASGAKAPYFGCRLATAGLKARPSGNWLALFSSRHYDPPVAPTFDLGSSIPVSRHHNLAPARTSLLEGDSGRAGLQPRR
jgi:hypothetical protein